MNTTQQSYFIIVWCVAMRNEVFYKIDENSIAWYDVFEVFLLGTLNKTDWLLSPCTSRKDLRDHYHRLYWDIS